MAVRARLAPPRPTREDWPWHSAKTLALPVSSLFGGDRRMEAEAYLLSGYGLRAALEARRGWEPLGQSAKVWQPSRLKGIQVGPKFGTPFLAATQVFDLRPIPRKWLALARTEGADGRFVKSGMILVTCSGSVGRATLAYAPHLDTLISHDLLRVEARDDKHWGWLYAYLRAPTVQAMMTSAQYGHMIKHLEVGHLNALPLPELPDALLDQFTINVRAVLEQRDQAHAATLDAEARFEECLGPLPPFDTGENGFTVRAADSLFSGRRRIDCWPYSPLVAAVKSHLHKQGLEVLSIRSCGYRVWVPGRYKRLPAEQGVVFMDSSDLFEINPDLIKRFADCDFGDQHHGRVKPGWLLMAASGQTYGIIGGVVLANDFYEGKAVANHVIRIAPTEQAQVRPGYMLTALSHPLLGRPVMKSFAFGSSVPEIDPEYVYEFGVVRLAAENEGYIADRAERAAEQRAEADLLENALADEAEQIITRFIAGDVFLHGHG